MDIQIDINSGELNKQLEKLQKKVTNLRPVLHELGNHLLNITEEAFDNEAGPDGQAWAPLNLDVIAQKKGETKKLYRYGHMQRSLNLDISNIAATLGLNAYSKGYPYPIVHQFGTLDGKILARPFLPIDKNGNLYPGIKVELVALLKDFMEGVVS